MRDIEEGGEGGDGRAAQVRAAGGGGRGSRKGKRVRVGEAWPGTHLVSLIYAMSRIPPSSCRYNYVTPTSYLELLTTFIKLLGEKRSEINETKRRLEVSGELGRSCLLASHPRSFLLPTQI